MGRVLLLLGTLLASVTLTSLAATACETARPPATPAKAQRATKAQAKPRLKTVTVRVTVPDRQTRQPARPRPR